ncbi:MAG: Ig-like domain-containing protein [Verrucomicrobiales bacterium]|nr:Ig-like domain-containing protein [Verrucomicrobiales bacterium]
MKSKKSAKFNMSRDHSFDGKPELHLEALEARVLFSGSPAPVEEPSPDSEPPEVADEAVAVDNSANPQQGAEAVPVGDESGIDAPVEEDPQLWALSQGETEVSSDHQVVLLRSGSEGQTLAQSQMEQLAEAAAERWRATGLTDEQSAALDAITYVITNLEPGRLGMADGSIITIDDDGAGGSWFIDGTPLLDEEFVADRGTLRALGNSFADGRFDLLTVILHEQGHAMGLSGVPASGTHLMNEFLIDGERRLPSVESADGAKQDASSGTEFLTAGGTSSYTTSEDAILDVAAPGAIGSGVEVELVNPTIVVQSTGAPAKVTTGSSMAATLTDTFAYNPLDPTGVLPVLKYGSANGVRGYEAGAETLLLTYDLATPVNLGAGSDFVLDLYGNDSWVEHDNDFDVEFLDGGAVVGVATGLAIPDGGPQHFRVSAASAGLGVGDTIDQVRIVARDATGTARNQFSLQEVRAAVITSMTLDSYDLTSASGAVVNMNADGSFTYDPTGSVTLRALEGGETIVDTFSVVASDGGSASTVTVTVIVNGVAEFVNSAPVAVNDTGEASVTGTSDFNVLANDTDVDLDDLPANFSVDSVSIVSTSGLVVSPSAAGSVSVEGNQIRFNPGTDFDELTEGESATVVVDYTMSDDSGASSSATLSITVMRPFSSTLNYATNEDTSLNVLSPGVLGSSEVLLVNPTIVVQSTGAPAKVTTGSNMAATLTDTFAYDPLDPTGVLPVLRYGAANGVRGYQAGAETLLLTYDLANPVNLGTGNALVFDLYGNDKWVIHDNDFDVQFLSAGTVVGTVAGLAIPDGGLQYLRVNSAGAGLGAGATIDQLRIVARDATGTARNQFSLQEVRAAVITGDSVMSADAFSANGAVVSVNPDGSFAYDPTGSVAVQSLDEGEVLEDTFDVVVTRDGVPSTLTVRIFVSGLNDAPVAVVDSGNATESGTTDFDVLFNDTDVDGDDNPVTFTLDSASIVSTSGLVASPAAVGGVSIVDGQVRFDPGTAFAELDTGDTATVLVNYTMSDSSGATSSSTLTITVDGEGTPPANVPPLAVADEGNAPEAGTTDFDVLANDTDADIDDTPANFSLDAVSIVSTLGLLASPAAVGSVSIVGGQVRFDPGSAFAELSTGETATVLVNYTMSDDEGASSSSTLTITVDGASALPNVAPVAVADTGSSTESGTTNFDVLANDTDADIDDVPANFSLDAVSIISTSGLVASPAAVGSVSIVGGQVRFDPGTAFSELELGESATVVVNYTMSDDEGASSSSTLTITVNGALPDPLNYTTTEDDVLNVTSPGVLGSSEIPLVNPTIVVESTGVPAKLTTGSSMAATLTDTFAYDPLDPTGVLPVLKYGGGNGVRGYEAGAETLLLTYDLASVVNLGAGNELVFDMYGNDRWVIHDNDFDVQFLSAGTVVGTAAGLAIPDGGPQHLRVSSADAGLGAGATIDQLRIVARDATGSARNQFSMQEVRAAVITGDAVLSYDAISANGATVLVLADGSFSYDPTGAAALQALDSGDSLVDTFDVVISSGGSSITSTVAVTVAGLNDAPVAVVDSGNAAENGTTDFDVLANDTDVDGDDNPATFTLDAVSIDSTSGLVASPAAVGSVSIVGGQVRFDPGTAFDELLVGETAMVVVNYTMSDDEGVSSSSTLTITVNGAFDLGDNTAPVAMDDTGVITEDAVLSVAANGVLGNDTDADSDPLTVVIFDAVSAKGAAVAVAANGSYTYDPTGSATLQALAGGATTTDTFTYTISDGNGGTDIATVTITVTGLNETNNAPTAVNDTGATDEDTVLNVAATGVLGNDTDSDLGDSLAVTAFDATSAKGATVVVAANGSYTYDPTGSATLQALTGGATTTDTFTYTISDGNGGTDIATVTITVTGVNDAPVAVADTGSMPENGTQPEFYDDFDVLANDTDIDSDDNPANFSLDSATVVSTSGLEISPSVAGVVSIENNQIRYNPGNDFDQLDPGETATVVINYTMSDDSGAQSSSTLTITMIGDNTPPLGTEDVVHIEVDPNDGTITAKEDLQVDIQVLGASVSTAPPNPTWYNVQGRIDINGTQQVFFDDDQPGLDGFAPGAIFYTDALIVAGDTILFGGNYVGGPGPHWTGSSPNPLNTLVLIDGDQPPSYLGGAGQQDLVTFLSDAGVLDVNGNIDIGPLDVIVVMELTHTDENNSGFDMNDLVLLVTFTPIP